MRELSAPVRLGAFGVVLAAVLAGSLGLGRATGGAGAQDAPAEPAHGQHAAAPTEASGTSLSSGGLLLDVPSTVLPPLQSTRFAFRVLDEDGPVTGFDVEQGKRMHLVIVRRDLARHAHVHPEMAPDGTWSALLTLGPGSYRAVADFSVAGARRSLAVDLAAPGMLQPQPLPAPATSATVDDLRVELARDGATLAFTAFRGAAPVVPEHYLGARGHVVAFRAGDLAYAHVHPSGEDGATTSYAAELPGPGTYRLFLELRVDGQVRAFPYTLEVT